MGLEKLKPQRADTKDAAPLHPLLVVPLPHGDQWGKIDSLGHFDVNIGKQTGAAHTCEFWLLK